MFSGVQYIMASGIRPGTVQVRTVHVRVDMFIYSCTYHVHVRAALRVSVCIFSFLDNVGCRTWDLHEPVSSLLHVYCVFSFDLCSLMLGVFRGTCTLTFIFSVYAECHCIFRLKPLDVMFDREFAQM